MREIELSSAQRYGLSLLLALFATLLLFLLMVSLISVRFKPQERPKVAQFENFVKVTLNTPLTVAEIRKKRNNAEQLLSPVLAPPLVRYKAETRAKTRPKNAEPDFNFAVGAPSTRPKIILPTIALPPPNRARANSLGMGGSSINQCTIAFTLGSDEISVTDLQWIDCIGKEMSDHAEVALYKWINSAPESYTSLNPQAGDTLSFTFTRRRSH